MVERQKALGRPGGVVMEGRDIGSVVFPLATAKIFLSASLEARVERRYRQYKQRGLDVSRQELARISPTGIGRTVNGTTSPLIIRPTPSSSTAVTVSLEQQNQAVRPRLSGQSRLWTWSWIRIWSRPGGNCPNHYRLAYGVFGALARFYGLKQYGNEGGALPRGCIVAVNHVSNWDPPLMGSTLHRYPVTPWPRRNSSRSGPWGRFSAGSTASPSNAPDTMPRPSLRPSPVHERAATS